MNLRGIEFGPVLGAAGVQGFFGEGYRHHKFLKPFGLDFSNCTFVAKTTTLNARGGNMPMKKDGITSRELKPRCIKVYFRQGMMLNAVGLSGPGAKALFETGRWQARTKPFFISFMSVEESAEKRVAELEEFVKMFAFYLPGFKAKVGLQINYSCPNILGLNLSHLIGEVVIGLKIASSLRIPLMPKFNILAPPEAVEKISNYPECDAVCLSNTLPWGKLPEEINWKKLFGSDVSPLAQFGGGGLSGRPLLGPAANWLKRAGNIAKPINGGGGILHPGDLDAFYYTYVRSIFIGSVATLRPWRVKKIIDRAYAIF